MITVDDWWQLFPIYLKEGVSKDEIRDDIAQQVREVASLMQRAPKTKTVASPDQGVPAESLDDEESDY